MAKNGLFIQARTNLLEASTQIAPANIRGLKDHREFVAMANGPIPIQLLQMGITWFQETPNTERYFAVSWDGAKYHPVIPDQEGGRAALTYAPPPGVVAEFHSHGSLDAFFSPTDTQDEQGFKIYGVAGRLDTNRPALALRLGIYGYFRPLTIKQVFTGHTPPRQEDRCPTT